MQIPNNGFDAIPHELNVDLIGMYSDLVTECTDIIYDLFDKLTPEQINEAIGKNPNIRKYYHLYKTGEWLADA